MYGRSFTLESSDDSGLSASVVGGGNPGPSTSAAGVLAYNEICYNIKHDRWTRRYDYDVESPYAYKGAKVVPDLLCISDFELIELWK